MPYHTGLMIRNECKQMEKLSKMIQVHRKASGLSRKALADIAGVGKTVIFDLEHGKQTVRLDTVLKVLDALNIKIHFQSPLEG